MAKFSLWIEGARPKTLIASISPVIIGSAIAFGYNTFNRATFICALLTGIFIQVGTNLANDYFDGKKGCDSPDRIGPRRIMQLGIISDLSMKRAIVCSFLMATSASIYLIIQGGPIISYLLILAILLGIGYTAGRFALAYLGLGDLFVFIFFGPIATFMTTYLHMGKFLGEAFIAGIAPGALSTAILTINHLRDHNSDKAASKKTLVVRLGEKFGKWEYTVLIFIAFSLPLIMRSVFDYNGLILLSSFLSLKGILLVRDVWIAENSKEYIPLLGKSALLLTLYTLIFSLGCLK